MKETKGGKRIEREQRTHPEDDRIPRKGKHLTERTCPACGSFIADDQFNRKWSAGTEQTDGSKDLPGHREVERSDDETISKQIEMLRGVPICI